MARTKAWDRLRAGEPYKPGATGWVVAFTTPASETRREFTTFWFGPGHGWGTTSGGLAHPGPRMWPTKVAAEQALRAVYGPPSRWRGRRPVRIADAEKATAD